MLAAPIQYSSAILALPNYCLITVQIKPVSRFDPEFPTADTFWIINITLYIVALTSPF